MRLISLFFFSTDLTDPLVSLFRLEDHIILPDGGPESELGRLLSPARCSKHVEVAIVNVSTLKGRRDDVLWWR